MTRDELETALDRGRLQVQSVNDARASGIDYPTAQHQFVVLRHRAIKPSTVPTVAN